MNAHVMQDHPDLLRNDSVAVSATVAEEEEEGADHCYFTKKNDTPQVPEPPKVRRVGRKKGRQKKVVKYEWDRMKKLDNYSSVEDRRERRRLKQLVKEQEDRLKKLTKSTCARTRSYQEHQEMKNGAKTLGAADRESQLRDRHLLQSRAARAAGHGTDEDESGMTESLGSGLYGIQPYLDHGYCKFESTGHEERLKQQRLPIAVQGRAADGSVVDTPDVSAFQECETQLLGLGGAMPLVRKRGRPPNSTLNRPVLEARRRLASVLESGAASSGVMQSTNYQTLRLAPRPTPSTSAVESATAAEDDGLDIADFFGADTDILHSSIIDELLGMTHASGANYPADGATRKVHPALVDVPHASGAKFPDHSNREVPEATSVIDHSFSDGLAIDSEAPLSADFDDIDLTEDVYSLFLGGGNNSVTPNSNGGATPLGNGEESNRIGGSGATAISGVQQDILSLTNFSASTSLLTNSPLHRGLVSPRRNSLLMRNSTVLQTPLVAGMSGAAATSTISAGTLVNQPVNVYTSGTVPTQVIPPPAVSAVPLTNPQQTRLLSNSTANPTTAVIGDATFQRTSFPGYAVSEGGSHWTQQQYLDTSGLLSLSEAANLCLSSDSRNTNGSLVPFVKPFNISKAGQVVEVSHLGDIGVKEGNPPSHSGENSSPAHDTSDALNGDSSHSESKDVGKETCGNPNGSSDDQSKNLRLIRWIL